MNIKALKGYLDGKNVLNYSYYPGCSLHASGKEYDESTRSLFKALKIGLTEVPDWLCCGATPAHNVDELCPCRCAPRTSASPNKFRVTWPWPAPPAFRG